MLYHLLYPLHTLFSIFNVFRYITFRTIYAILTALLISFIIGPWLINKLRDFQIRQVIREDVPSRHMIKNGTPTMGGSLILGGILVPTLCWADLTNVYIWIVLLTTLGFGALGFLDDYKKIRDKDGMGIRARYKFPIQMAMGLIASLVLFSTIDHDSRLIFPFFKRVMPDLGNWYILFSMLVIVGSANAVNLTDGLDGLAIGPVLIASSTFMLFCYLAGNFKFATYLQIPFVRGSAELTILCGAMVGSGLGFLWFNTYPAQVFMGDIGSLALGAALGTIAVVDQTGDPSGDRGRDLCDRGPLGHHPGDFLQSAKEKGLPDGAHSPPLRIERVGRAQDHRAVLDHCHYPRTGGDQHPETKVKT